MRKAQYDGRRSHDNESWRANGWPFCLSLRDGIQVKWPLADVRGSRARGNWYASLESRPDGFARTIMAINLGGEARSFVGEDFRCDVGFDMKERREETTAEAHFPPAPVLEYR